MNSQVCFVLFCEKINAFSVVRRFWSEQVRSVFYLSLQCSHLGYDCSKLLHVPLEALAVTSLYYQHYFNSTRAKQIMASSCDPLDCMQLALTDKLRLKRGIYNQV